MKKIFLMFAMLLMGMSLAWATATQVDGTVYSSPDTSTPVGAGIMVDVTCLETSSSSTVPTSAAGEYFTSVECELGHTVKACVSTICNSAVVSDQLPQEINIVGVDIFNVPEFGVIAALAALAGSGIVFAIIRKRK